MNVDSGRILPENEIPPNERLDGTWVKLPRGYQPPSNPVDDWERARILADEVKRIAKRDADRRKRRAKIAKASRRRNRAH